MEGGQWATDRVTHVWSDFRLFIPPRPYAFFLTTGGPVTLAVIDADGVQKRLVSPKELDAMLKRGSRGKGGRGGGWGGGSSKEKGR